jgi:hypothetical protein
MPQMLQKPDPEPGSFGGTFDQTRYVGHHETAVRLYRNYAEIRIQGRKRVVRYLGPRRGYRSNQGRFAGIRHAQQTDVSQQRQLQLEVPALTRCSGCRLAWRAVSTRLETRIALAPCSAGCDQQLIVIARQIAQHLTGFFGIDTRTAGYWNTQTVSAAPGPVLTHATCTVASLESALRLKIHQRIDTPIGDQVHAPTVAAITAIRTTTGHIFFATETHAAGTSVTSLNPDRDFIDKFHGEIFPTKNPA